MEITKHFTSSVYIIYNDKVLLHKHKKYDLILPVGGHIDRDELPHNAAIREAKEETGLDIKLLNTNKLKENNFENSIQLNRGTHLNLHNVGQEHQHIDFVFFTTCKTDKINPQENESKEIFWYCKEEIENSTKITPEVKTYAIEALEKLKYTI